jgi:hypothetical protein
MKALTVGEEVSISSMHRVNSTLLATKEQKVDNILETHH